MAIHRRFTARKGIFALLLTLFVVLVLHPGRKSRAVNVFVSHKAGEGRRGGATGAVNNVSGGNQAVFKNIGGGKGGKGGKGGSGKKSRKTAVVVASQDGENSTWLEEYFPHWEKNIYKVDDKKAKLTVPMNKGRESMVYLTYIIDHYNNLPDNILFIHPTRYQWHNDDPDYDGLPMLRHFQLPYLEQEGYVNIRCAWSLGCPSEIKPLAEEGEHREAVHAGGDYKKAFEELFPGKPVPNKVGVSCCAQFAVTREKIRERRREEYVRYRKWLMETELGDNISGRVLEYSWHMIFGKEAVHCPTAAVCYCKVFGLCNIKCDEDGSCEGRYILPPYSTLPEGWPYTGWEKEPRNRSSPED